MTFAKLEAHHYYLRVDYDKMRLYNYKGGWRDIDENSDEWMFATLVEADGWRDLYLKTGYCPLTCSYADRDIWMDPDGMTYEGVAHELCAEKIGEIHFGKEDMYAVFIYANVKLALVKMVVRVDDNRG